MQLEGAEAAFAEAARMLARARASGIPVFHIMHDAGQGSPYDVTAEIGQISDEVAPIAGEPVIVKNYPSSFFQTDLGAQLEKTGRHDLVLAGFMTHMCVNSTARDAFNLGYRPTVVASATATRELPVSGGTPVPATTLQTATLAPESLTCSRWWPTRPTTSPADRTWRGPGLRERLRARIRLRSQRDRALATETVKSNPATGGRLLRSRCASRAAAFRGAHDDRDSRELRQGGAGCYTHPGTVTSPLP